MKVKILNRNKYKDRELNKKNYIIKTMKWKQKIKDKVIIIETEANT